VDYLELLEVFKGVEELDRESPDKVMVEPLHDEWVWNYVEVIDFQEFKEVHAEKFE